MKQWLVKIVNDLSVTTNYILVALLHKTSFEDLNKYILLKIKLVIIEVIICKIDYLMMCN